MTQLVMSVVDNENSDDDNADSVISVFFIMVRKCRINEGVDTSLANGRSSGEFLKIADVDTEMFINAANYHNQKWDLGMQLELYKQNNPGLSKEEKKYTYYASCPCDNFCKQWLQSKEVDIENSMDRCKFKP